MPREEFKCRVLSPSTICLATLGVFQPPDRLAVTYRLVFELTMTKCDTDQIASNWCERLTSCLFYK